MPKIMFSFALNAREIEGRLQIKHQNKKENKNKKCNLLID